MKTVYSNANECIHAFATFGDDSTTHGRSSNTFWEKGILYSYGYHFPMARFIDDYNLLFTLRGYSATTSKHLWWAQSALSHKELIYTYDVKYLVDAAKGFEFSIEQSMKKLVKARKPIIYEDNIRKELNRIDVLLKVSKKAYSGCDLVEGVKALKKLVKSTNAFLDNENKKEAYQQKVKKAKKEVEKANKIRKAKEAKRKAEQEKKFVDGEIDYLSSDWQLLRDEGKIIRTSLDVRIPREMAKKLYERLKAGAVKEGEKFKDWTVYDVEKDYLRIGCHLFKMDYLLDFGSKL